MVLKSIQFEVLIPADTLWSHSFIGHIKQEELSIYIVNSINCKQEVIGV